MLRAPLIVIALAVALGASRLARAEPKQPEQLFSATLTYVAPPACPPSDDFKAVVVKRLGFDPFNEKAQRHVFASISEGEHQLEGRLEWRDAKGKWVGDQAFPVQTSDCAELVRAMGFALAVQIHLLTVERPLASEEDAEAPDDGTKTEPDAHPTQPKPPVKPPPPRRPDEAGGSEAPETSDRNGMPWWFAFGVGGSLGVGLAPHPAGFGRLFASAGLGPASLELGGELSTKTSAHRADGGGFTVHQWLASAALCGNEGHWSLCLLGKRSALSVRGTRVDVPASPSGNAFAMGLRFAARQNLGSTLFIAGRLEGLANVTRWTVTLDHLPVWTAPAVAGTAGVDVGAIFQ